MEYSTGSSCSSVPFLMTPNKLNLMHKGLKLVSITQLGDTIFVYQFENDDQTNYILMNENVILHYLSHKSVAMLFLCQMTAALSPAI